MIFDELTLMLKAGNRTAIRRQPSNIIHDLAQLFHAQLEHLADGEDTLVLRIVKLATPAVCTIQDYDGWLTAPKEGELVHIRTRRGGRAVWRMSARLAKGEVIQDLIRRADTGSIK